MSAPRYTVANSMPYDRHVTDVAGRQRFSVDIQGLLEALTEQFPEPLLCVRELVQNAADAGAQRIEVDVSYDASRQLFRIAVRDDGRGMSEPEVEGYLTIGFSEKDPGRQRGRFGVGKLSPYALDIVRMVVETCDGQVAHRLTFNGDGSGQLARVDLRIARHFVGLEIDDLEFVVSHAQQIHAPFIFPIEHAPLGQLPCFAQLAQRGLRVVGVLAGAVEAR